MYIINWLCYTDDCLDLLVNYDINDLVNEANLIQQKSFELLIDISFIIQGKQIAMHRGN